MKIELKQKKDLLFEGSNEQGAKIDIGISEEVEHDVVRPMQMLLMAIAGCSSVDIITILKKQRQTIDDYRVEVNGHRIQDKIPAIFESIEVRYFFEGDIKPAKIKRAIELSLNTYCSVTKIIEQSATINYTTYLNNKII